MRRVFGILFDPRLQPLSIAAWQYVEQALERPDPVGASWQPPRASFMSRDPLTGSPYVRGGFAPVFETAVAFALLGDCLERLRPRLESDCEFLPLDCEGTRAELLHVTRSIECLDRSRSPALTGVLGSDDEPHRDYVFLPGSVGDVFCFSSPDGEGGIFFTQLFVDLLRSEGVQGARFVERGVA